MKKIFTISLFLILIMGQSREQDSPSVRPSATTTPAITELKDKIAAVYDTLQYLRDQRDIKIQQLKNEKKKKVVVERHSTIKIIYRDTCMARIEVRYIYLKEAKDTVMVEKLFTVPIKKAKWFEFKKRRQQNKQQQIKDSIE